ncbi:MAG: hypothetical protein P4L84_22280, partial [Isosphaeraceae bacterium]|nr:hypothetical protein [Isosphaeraceae bacterium]
MRKLCALLCGSLLLLGLTTVRALPQGASDASDPPREPEALRPLERETTAVRLILGIGDTAVRPWNGKVKVDKGEVIGVEGWRFRQDDAVKGRDAWEGRSLAVRNPAAVKKA